MEKRKSGILGKLKLGQTEKVYFVFSRGKVASNSIAIQSA